MYNIQATQVSHGENWGWGHAGWSTGSSHMFAISEASVLRMASNGYGSVYLSTLNTDKTESSFNMLNIDGDRGKHETQLT